MKCNVDKISQFFQTENYSPEIKELVLNLLKAYCLEKNIETDVARVSLIGLDFYEVEPDDYFDESECKVIDFYKLSTFGPDLQKFVLDMIKVMIKDDDDVDTSDFLEDFLREDLKLLVPYEKWKKTNRKNKLKKLKEIV